MLTSEEFFIIKKCNEEERDPTLYSLPFYILMSSSTVQWIIIRHWLIQKCLVFICSFLFLLFRFLIPYWFTVVRTFHYCGRNSGRLWESDNAVKWIITHIKWLNNKLHLTETNVLPRHWFIVFFFRNTINLMTMWNHHYCVLFLYSAEASAFKWGRLWKAQSGKHTQSRHFVNLYG